MHLLPFIYFNIALHFKKMTVIYNFIIREVFRQLEIDNEADLDIYSNRAFLCLARRNRSFHFDDSASTLTKSIASSYEINCRVWKASTCNFSWEERWQCKKRQFSISESMMSLLCGENRTFRFFLLLTWEHNIFFECRCSMKQYWLNKTVWWEEWRRKNFQISLY